jgi:hypothetical protein
MATKLQLEAEAKAREAEMAELQAQLEAAKKKAEAELAEAKAREAKLKADLEAREAEKADAEARAKKADEKQVFNPALGWVIVAVVVILIVLRIVFWWANRPSQPDSRTVQSTSSDQESVHTAQRRAEEAEERVRKLKQSPQQEAQKQAQRQRDEEISRRIVEISSTIVQRAQLPPPSPHLKALELASQTPGGTSVDLKELGLWWRSGESATEYEKGEAEKKRLEALAKIEGDRFDRQETLQAKEHCQEWQLYDDWLTRKEQGQKEMTSAVMQRTSELETGLKGQIANLQHQLAEAQTQLHKAVASSSPDVQVLVTNVMQMRASLAKMEGKLSTLSSDMEALRSRGQSIPFPPSPTRACGSRY